eukprot:TRINITY_DN8806_c0_g1_i4.p1 TRINITY_DN8806_c0_g1~~TRINITY_DN8806_c0_g1_i4.p1  ORF type:complete len:555 (+),score=158.71 TRINITY_DN8806_c0_g1_i4:90-1754(+)
MTQDGYAVVQPGVAPSVLAAYSADDNAWALKREWTDTVFQEGAEANAAQLKSFEDTLVARLKNSCARASAADSAAEPEAVDVVSGASSGDVNVLARVLTVGTSGGLPSDDIRAAVLHDPEVLGSCLDIVGAYLKNYEIDKAAAVMETIMPVCQERGGFWYAKALNHIATVRMKQSRPNEALQAMRELERHVDMNEDEKVQAWEFWETVYRNFGWVYSSLSREEDAIGYIEKAIEVKKAVGRPESWFDIWDLGRMKACQALRGSSSPDIESAGALVTRALWLQKEAEPKDFVMRAKIWHSVGECSFALGHVEELRVNGKRQHLDYPNAPATSSQAMKHYKKALKCFKESHKLFKATEGAYNPLTGAEAQAVAWACLKVGEAEAAKPFLLDCIEATSRQQSAWGSASTPEATSPAMLNAFLTVERIMETHRTTDDRPGLVKYFDAVERLCDNICKRVQLSKDQKTEAAIYEKLVSTCSMILVASDTPGAMERSQKLMDKFMWDNPSTPQAQLCNEVLGRALTNGIGADSDEQQMGPGMQAFLQAMAAAQAAQGGGL